MNTCIVYKLFKNIAIIFDNYRVWSKINVGCTLYITAVNDSHIWKITNEEGLLVYEPDILISNTAVVGKNI